MGWLSPVEDALKRPGDVIGFFLLVRPLTVKIICRTKPARKMRLLANLECMRGMG